MLDMTEWLNWTEMNPLRRRQDTALLLHNFFLVRSSFVSAFSSLISNCLSLLFETQGRSRRVKPFSYKQETGNTEKICTQESLTVSFSVSTAALSRSTWATVALVICKTWTLKTGREWVLGSMALTHFGSHRINHLSVQTLCKTMIEVISCINKKV